MISSVVADVHVRAGQQFENQAVRPAVGAYVLLPRLGWLSRDAAQLRHARPALWRRRSRRRQCRWPAAVPAGAGVARGAGTVLAGRPGHAASFLVSHVSPFGSAAAPVVSVLTLVLVVARTRTSRRGRAAGGRACAARRAPVSIPDKVAQASKRLALLARSALTGRAFLASLGCAWAGLLSLDLMFVAVRYQPGFGPLAVAYSAANVVSALPVTPGGLGVAEVTLMAITVGFGAPRPTAVLAVLGYRLVNYWLALLPGWWPAFASG
jgi:lysylphosphatidylglycerol synthase-like protein